MKGYTSDIKFDIAMDEIILSLSYGEVYNITPFDLITGKPMLGGLFCPIIFGSVKCNECLCDMPTLEKSSYCKICGVDFTIGQVAARSRFGHIQLAVPVVHTWFHKSASWVLAILLNKPLNVIYGLINCKLHIIDKDISNDYKSGKIINTDTYKELWNNKNFVKVLSGGKAILKLLSGVCLKTLRSFYKNKCKKNNSEDFLNKMSYKINIIDGFINNNINPISIVINVLPVLPFKLRPILILKGKTYVNSGFNGLYNYILKANRDVFEKLEAIKNNKIVDLYEYLNTLIVLQETVNALIYDDNIINKQVSYNSVTLKSLSELLKGKTGRFRNNLLGKRVDYSGRSVIVPGPELLLCECAIPRIMALELFKPFIDIKIQLRYGIKNIDNIKLKVPNLENVMLEEVVKYCPVILNRAPTLHKLSMRAFWVKLTNEKAIRLHPLTCSGFNADFDGDQMAVHIPLSLKARIEVILLMMSVRNVLHPAHGSPCILPTQDMIMGLYYMSLISNDVSDMCFDSYADVDTALFNKTVSLHTKVKFNVVLNGKCVVITSTPGRLLIMEIIPSKCGFTYEWFKSDFDKNLIFKTIELVYSKCGQHEMIIFCAALMKLGFKYASQSGISFSKNDLVISNYKNMLLNKIRIILSTLYYKSMYDKDKLAILKRILFTVLNKIYDTVDLKVLRCSKNQTPIQIMFNSGARATLLQLRQLMMLRGYVFGFNNEQFEIPILKSYYEGLSFTQFFCCVCTSRRDIIDTALKTPNSGCLTRKLIEATREYIVREFDCGTKLCFDIKPILNISFIKNRLIGRVLARPIVCDNIVIFKRNDIITYDNIGMILDNSVGLISIRSPLICQAKNGVCKLCYGISLGTDKLVELGDSVGVLAAQAAGEPGTQLALRTFHGLNDFKYKNKDYGYINKEYLYAPYSGIIKITNLSSVCNPLGNIITIGMKCVISIFQGNVLIWSQVLPRGVYLIAINNMHVNSGEVLCFNYFFEIDFVSLVNGIILFKNLICDFNFKKSNDLQLEFIKYDAIDKLNFPFVCLNIGWNKLYCWFSFIAKSESELLINPGMQVHILNILLKVKIISYDVTFPFSFGGFYKLSRFFENRIILNNRSMISCTTGILRRGNSFGNYVVYIIDSACVAMLPVVYIVYNNEYLLKDNSKINKGQVVLPGEIEFFDYINIYGFNEFLNYFVDIIQEIYESQGVNINSKHIEVILKQMIITVPMDNNVNKNKLFIKQVIGINDLCLNQLSPLSNISFQGNIKSIVNAIIFNGFSKLTDVKDRIIMGELPFIGVNVNKN